jgi:hypothetical protein
VTTITIELLQIRIIAGRDASLGDVLTNALGALLGILLADTWRAWILPTPQEARWRALLATGGWCAAMAIGAWGVRVSLPPTRYWGQWAPELLGFDPFTGTLLHATVAGVPFPEGAMGDSPRFRSSLLSDSVLVQATVIAGPPTRRVAPIVSVYDMYRTQIFLLGQNGRDLVFSIRTHAADARLRGPAIRLEDVFPPHAGDTLELAAGIIGRRLWIHASPRGGARESRERAVALGPALGWSFLLPFFHAYGSETPWLSALWVAGLLFPVGYWARRWRGGAAAAMLAVALVALGAAAVVFRAHAPGWWSWAAAVVGWSAGAALGAWTVARSRRERSDALAGAPAHDPGTLLTF